MPERDSSPVKAAEHSKPDESLPSILSAQEASEAVAMLMQCSEKLGASCDRYWALRHRTILLTLWGVGMASALMLGRNLVQELQSILPVAILPVLAILALALAMLFSLKLASEMREARRRVRFYMARLVTIARVVSQIQDKGRVNTWERLRLGIALSDAELALEQALKINHEQAHQARKDYPLLKNAMSEQPPGLRIPVPRHDP